MGARGAKTAAYHIEPKYALVLDCIQACGTPDCNNRGAVMGKGVCLDVLEKGFAANKIMTEFLSKTAVENKIDYIKVITESESSDASSIHLSGAGVYTSRVSADVYKRQVNI